MRFKAKIAVVVFIVAIALAGVCYKVRTSFPGCFTYVSGAQITHLTASGKRISGVDSPLARIREHPCLALSRDGMSLAYLECEGVQIKGIALQRHDKKKQRFGTRRYIDVSSYGIRQCPQSNLAWSPDGQQLAYADQGTLYILHVTSRKLSSSKLPQDSHERAMLSEWHANYREPRHLTPSELKNIGKKYASTIRAMDKRDDPLASKQLARQLQGLALIDADTAQRTPLSPGAQRQIDYAKAQIKKAFSVDSKPPLRVVSCWNDLSKARIVTEGKDQVMEKQFMYEGHHLSWVSKDTIYCDNWKLRINGLTEDNVELRSERTPLMSVYSAKPLWSPRGDKAAYLIYAQNPNDPERLFSAVLAITDASGKLITKWRVSALEDRVNWSADGKHIALISLGKRYKQEFSIYDIESSRRWSIGMNEPVAGIVNQWDYN